MIHFGFVRVSSLEHRGMPIFGRAILSSSAHAMGMHSQSTRNQESTVWPDHHDSGRKDPVQDDPSRRGLEQNVRSSVLEHDDVSHIEEYQEYMLRGKECLGRLV